MTSQAQPLGTSPGSPHQEAQHWPQVQRTRDCPLLTCLGTDDQTPAFYCFHRSPGTGWGKWWRWSHRGPIKVKEPRLGVRGVARPHVSLGSGS